MKFDIRPLTDKELEKVRAKCLDGSPRGWYKTDVPGLLLTIEQLQKGVFERLREKLKTMTPKGRLELVNELFRDYCQRCGDMYQGDDGVCYCDPVFDE